MTLSSPQNCLPQITQVLGSKGAGEPRSSELLARGLAPGLSAWSAQHANGAHSAGSQSCLYSFSGCLAWSNLGCKTRPQLSFISDLQCVAYFSGASSKEPHWPVVTFTQVNR